MKSDEANATVAYSFHTRSLSLSKYACILYEHGDHSRLLRCLPNLQHLSLSPPPVYDRTQRDLPLQSLRLGLGHIQHSSPEQQHQTLQIIAHNFWLPSLRKIQLQALLSDFTETIDPHPYFPLPPTRELSCVEDIRISQCIDRSFGTDQRMVQRLLGNTRSLKRFVFDNSWQPGAIVIGDREVDITERVAYDIKDGLEYHTSTLEEIVISADDGGFGSSFALRQHLNFNGKEFTEVRRLALLEVMFLVDFPYDGKKAFLSDKLEEIQVQFTVKVGDFRGDDREDQDLDERVWKMEWLLSLKGNELPNLKRVIWWYQPFQSHEGKVRAGAGGPLFGSLPTLQKLQGMFEQVGVKFEWISTRLLSETPFGMRLND